ncbi:MAG TPA: hypothetical protein VGC84_10360 [Ilumatobacteraceae bacterium]|jgi:hypothetical protein
MRFTLVAAAIIASVALPPMPASAAPDTTPNASIASFYGGQIDLRRGWGDATACSTDGVATQCFRTEKELDGYLATQAAAASLEADATQALATGDVTIAAAAPCATNVRLYSNTFFGGSVLAVAIRDQVVNLSTWSFSNITSSYQIGQCPATFWDLANAGLPSYPGGTLAGASATVMWSGWDNRISSLYIS